MPLLTRPRPQFPSSSGQLGCTHLWGVFIALLLLTQLVVSCWEHRDLLTFGAAPPMARCSDGSISHSRNRSGTCSRHGGVEEWLR